MSTPLKNIAIAGASGSIGAPIFKKLVASGKFNVRVLRYLGSSSSFHRSIVLDVDFTSVDSLTAALRGQHAVVSAVGSSASGSGGTFLDAISAQNIMIDAAIAAGVQRFVPSEFGTDLDNIKNCTLPLFASKIKVQNYLIEKSRVTGLSYTFVYTGPFLDWGLEHNFLLRTSNLKPLIYDSGDVVFSASNVGSIGEGVVGLLSHPDDTKNRPIYIEDIKITQNRLFALAKKAAPHTAWEEPEFIKLDDITAVSDVRLSQGLYDPETFTPYILRSIFDPLCGTNFTMTDNDLLGLTGIVEADIVDMFRRVLK